MWTSGTLDSDRHKIYATRASPLTPSWVSRGHNSRTSIDDYTLLDSGCHIGQPTQYDAQLMTEFLYAINQ